MGAGQFSHLHFSGLGSAGQYILDKWIWLRELGLDPPILFNLDKGPTLANYVNL